MEKFVDFAWRIRYLIWPLVAWALVYTCYSLWNGTNFFLHQSQDFWSGFVFGGVLVGMLFIIKITVPRRKPA